MTTATIGGGKAFEPRLTPGPLVKRLVLRTADGGHHWQNVTPPALSAQMAGELPSQYLDQDRAFVMALAGPGQIRGMRTRDGRTLREGNNHPHPHSGGRHRGNGPTPVTLC